MGRLIGFDSHLPVTLLRLCRMATEIELLVLQSKESTP
jgi:hypothetical protein